MHILESTHETTREDVKWDVDGARAVDVTCRVGDQRYAIEHTLIEPFPDNLRDDISFDAVLGAAIEDHVRDLLRADLAYNLYVDVYAFKDFKRAELPLVRERILAWLRESVPLLPEPTEFPQTSLYAEPPRTPVRIRLSCHRSTALGGRLNTGRFAPERLDALQLERLRKALEDKCPKLHAAKSSATRTVLVLENNDIALTNESDVGDKIDSLAREIAHMPDDIYMVNTYRGDNLYVAQLRRSGRPCLLVGVGNDRWEFNAQTLKRV